MVGSKYITTDLSGYNTALVLGTSPYVQNRNNIFYTGRIQAMYRLYRDANISTIIVSGDGIVANYDEPKYMYESLV